MMTELFFYLDVLIEPGLNLSPVCETMPQNKHNCIDIQAFI